MAGRVPCTEPGCSSTFTTVGTRNGHVKAKHGGRVLLCQYCNKGFGDISNHRRHENKCRAQSQSGLTVQYFCPWLGCSYSGPRRDNVKRHTPGCGRNPHDRQFLPDPIKVSVKEQESLGPVDVSSRQVGSAGTPAQTAPMASLASAASVAPAPVQQQWEEVVDEQYLTAPLFETSAALGPPLTNGGYQAYVDPVIEQDDTTVLEQMVQRATMLAALAGDGAPQQPLDLEKLAEEVDFEEVDFEEVDFGVPLPQLPSVPEELAGPQDSSQWRQEAPLWSGAAARDSLPVWTGGQDPLGLPTDPVGSNQQGFFEEGYAPVAQGGFFLPMNPAQPMPQGVVPVTTGIQEQVEGSSSRCSLFSDSGDASLTFSSVEEEWLNTFG